MALSDKKALFVLPPRDYQDEEYGVTRKILESKGIKVSVASIHPGEIRGLKGTPARADVLVDNIKYYDYDAIIFVGGSGARQYFDHDKALKLAKDADHKVLGATSTAVGILASAGVLKEKKATSEASVVDLLRSKGAAYTSRPVEVDEKIVTSQAPAYAEHFGNAIIKALQK
jgi:protease I